MNIELNDTERDLLKRVLESYLSELRLDIAATKRGTSPLHGEEDQIKGLIKKLS